VSPKPKNRFKRKAPFRESHLIFIACEGTITEPTYFRRVSQHLRCTRYKVVILERDNNQNRPEQLLAHLLELRNSRKVRKEDKLFLVSDKDNWEETELNEVAQGCSKNEITLALSNPCFEYWLLLHCEDFDVNHDEWDCQQVTTKLSDLLGGYRKSNPCKPKILKGINTALERGEEMYNPDDSWPLGNGSLVHKVVRLLKGKY